MPRSLSRKLAPSLRPEEKAPEGRKNGQLPGLERLLGLPTFRLAELYRQDSALGGSERARSILHILAGREGRDFARALAQGGAAGVLARTDGGAAPAAALDLGTPIAGATEVFYNINQPVLANVRNHFLVVGGARYAGWTSWNYGYGAWTARPDAGGFVLRPIPWRINSLTVKLPRWVNLASAREVDRQEWARFMRCVRLHEQGHVNLVHWHDAFAGVDHPEVRGATVAALSANLQALAQQLRAALQLDSDNYDVETGHGATQGAVLRPPP